MMSNVLPRFFRDTVYSVNTPLGLVDDVRRCGVSAISARGPIVADTADTLISHKPAGGNVSSFSLEEVHRNP